MTERASSNWKVVDKQSEREQISCGFCHAEIGEAAQHLLHSHNGTICVKCLRELEELLHNEVHNHSTVSREEKDKTTTEDQQISSGLEFQSGTPLYCKFCLNDSQQCEHLALAPTRVVGICSSCVSEGNTLGSIGIQKMKALSV